jgi:hypothetical protein
VVPRTPARTQRGSDRDSNQVVAAAVAARIGRGEDQGGVLHCGVGVSQQQEKLRGEGRAPWMDRWEWSRGYAGAG